MEGVLQMRTSALFGAKTFKFFKIYGVSARTRGLSSADILRTRGRGQFFAILCRRLLWTAPKQVVMLLCFELKPIQQTIINKPETIT